MHTAANSSYNLNDVLYKNILYPLSYAPFLFMLVSAFSVCCGYYERMKKGEISLNKFYTKRYIRILPFFALLVLLEAAYTHILPSFLEAISDISLGFGLLPNAASEIGIVWPHMSGEYTGSASGNGYAIDGMPLRLSEKDQKWLGLRDTFRFRGAEK